MRPEPATAPAANDFDRPPLLERLLDVPGAVSPLAWRGRLLLFVLVAVWGLAVWLTPLTRPSPILHLTVILFHEAGHVLFMPFGDVLRVAGGTFGQLLMPLVCAIALHRQDDNFGASVAAAWMAMSLVDAAVYAWDAAAPVLPLIGGGTGADSFHDFVFLFERFHQLGHAHAWARVMSGFGLVLLLASLAWGAVLLVRQKENVE